MYLYTTNYELIHRSAIMHCCCTFDFCFHRQQSKNGCRIDASIAGHDRTTNMKARAVRAAVSAEKRLFECCFGVFNGQCMTVVIGWKWNSVLIPYARKADVGHGNAGNQDCG